MKIKILDLAIQDLENAQHFYAKQQESLAKYFLDAMFADIESLQLYAGFIRSILVTIDYWQKISLRDLL